MKRIRANLIRHWMAVAVVVTCLSLATVQADDGRSEYDRYLAAYQKYSAAVSRGAPVAEIQALLQEYRAAQTAYQRAYNLEGSGGTDPVPVVPPAPSSADLDAPAIDAALVGGGAPRQVVAEAALPRELKDIIDGLNGRDAKKNANVLIAKLESYIAQHPNVAELPRARYELAAAYETLKKDTKKSAALLQKLATDPRAGRYAGLASLRLRYQQARVQLAGWQQAMQGQHTQVQASLTKYSNTSWFALPVKVFRYVGYVGDSLKLNSRHKDFQKFQLYYEDLAARFVPSCQRVFDEFDAGPGDPTTRVRLIYDNVTSWFARWHILRNARRSIDIQYFIVEDDIFGMSMLGLLLEKARAGVHIRLMLDARGTKGLPRKFLGQDFLQEIKQYPHVQIRTFNPVHRSLLGIFGNFRQMMASNHDKIMLIDDEYLVIGGRNIAAHYFVDPRDDPTVYRDCDVLLHGTAVGASIKTAFEDEFETLRNWDVAPDLFGNADPMNRELIAAVHACEYMMRSGRLLQYPEDAKYDKRYLKAVKTYNQELAKYRHLTGYDRFRPFEGAHDLPVKIVDKHALTGYRNDITAEMVRYIDACKREVIIQNPYVVLTERAEAALKRAARRGVRIIMHTNSPISTDSMATQAMFYADWKRILKEIPTLEIYTYVGQRKLHAKNFIFDGQVSVVGTYNMDYLSEEVNSEVCAVIDGPAFAAEMRRAIMADVAVSRRIEIRVLEDGTIESVYGPDQQATGKTKLILEVLSRLKFLKPLI